MRYYRVKPQYDGTMLKNGKSLIANELFTETEIRKNGVHLACVDAVEVSKKKVFMSFGARFEAKE